MDVYRGVHERSLSHPIDFWGEAANAVDWVTPPSKVLDDSKPPFYRWFVDGELNTCYNALDRHAQGSRGDQLALIHDSAVTGEVQRFTYRELCDRTALFAGVLTKLGVQKGDRVVIYMPMVPETAIAMLACARIGAVHSVVFGGFAPKELATRIDDARPVLLISASCGIEGTRVVPYKPMLDQAIELSAHAPDKCIILQRPMCAADMKSERDIDWLDAMASASPVGCVTVKATDPLYILYTSGTTGEPKGIVRDNGGHAVALHWSMANIYGASPGEVFWAASDLGWVVGHSYIVYGPLLHGNTTVMYEGKPVGTPDAGAFWRVAADHRVSTMFTAPTAFRAIKQHDPEGKLVSGHDLSALRALFLAGERCDPNTLAWAQSKLGVDVIDHWWQTESGWPIAANCLGVEKLVVKPGSAGCAVPGWDVQVLSDAGQPVPPGTMGEIVCRLPLPPGAFPTLWNKDDRYRETYMTRFWGFYKTDDAGYLDEEGYVFVMARTDDIINVAGHRLSTGGIEQVLGDHPDVAECAVIGAADAVKGQVPVGFLVLKGGVTTDREEIVRQVVAKVRADIGPVAAFKQAIIVERLPKTRSGKILRRTMSKIADGEPFRVPPTIEDPAVIDEMREALKAIGRGGTG